MRGGGERSARLTEPEDESSVGRVSRMHKAEHCRSEDGEEAEGEEKVPVHPVLGDVLLDVSWRRGRVWRTW